MSPLALEAYAYGYHGGQRLQHVPGVIDTEMGKAGDFDGRYHLDVRMRLAGYIVGFSDGWHGAPALVPPRDLITDEES